jgi:peroxiredoxin
VSSDDAATSDAFRSELGAGFGFIADPKAELIRQYGVKTPLLRYARRHTFVIGRGRRVLAVDSGGRAIDPTTAVDACSLY